MEIKQIPEDFIVNEVIDLKINNGNYLIYKLRKKDWDSFKIIETIAKKLKIKAKLIGYAGNKDKKAITTQYISFYKVDKNKIDNLRINDVELEFVGYSNERINLGDLKGNSFIITIRNLDNKKDVPRNIQLENYFDDQRFGNKFNTHLVGKNIVKKDFKKSCELLEINLINNDFIGELRKVQRRLLRFYISSYQSYLFNLILSKYIEQFNHSYIESKIGKLAVSKDNLENFEIPLISFDAKFDEKIKEIAEKILKEEVNLNDFIIKQMPELINPTSYRTAFIFVDNIKFSYKNDELNNGKYKCVLEFFLPKGSYATLLIKKLEMYLN